MVSSPQHVDSTASSTKQYTKSLQSTELFTVRRFSNICKHKFTRQSVGNDLDELTCCLVICSGIDGLQILIMSSDLLYLIRSARYDADMKPIRSWYEADTKLIRGCNCHCQTFLQTVGRQSSDSSTRRLVTRLPIGWINKIHFSNPKTMITVNCFGEPYVLAN